MPTTATRIRRSARRPQLARDTPLIAIAAARQVVEEVSVFLGVSLPAAFAAGLAHRATRAFAHSSSFRKKVARHGDTGRDYLYLFLRHWLAARLHTEHPNLYAQLPRDFAIGVPLPNHPISPTRTPICYRRKLHQRPA
jgi:hypothetical protein